MSKLVKKFNLSDLWEYGKNESWFSDMAAKGLHLKSFGKYLVTFEKGQPKKTKYRIEIFEESPSQEQLDLYKEYGWELVTHKLIFYVFSSPEELNAPELHTDPMEQSFTFKMINKQIKKNTIVFSIAILLILSLIFYQFFFDDKPYLSLIRRSSFTLIFMAIGYIYVLIESIRGYISVKKIKDSLNMGIPMNHSKKWKKTYFFSSVLYISLIVLVLSAIFMPIYTVILRDIRTSPKALQNLPTISINDIENNVYDYWHDLDYEWSILSPVQYSTYEGGYVDGEIQEDFSGAYTHASLQMRYYELTFKGMAKGLINDLIHRYYRDVKGDLIEVEYDKFDLLYVGDKDNSKLIFASFDNKVVYINYYGKESVEKIVSLLEKKYDL